MIIGESEQSAANRVALGKLLREARENPTPAMLRVRCKQELAYQRAADIATGRRAALR